MAAPPPLPLRREGVRAMLSALHRPQAAWRAAVRGALPAAAAPSAAPSASAAAECVPWVLLGPWLVRQVAPHVCGRDQLELLR
eukprot:2032-Prymnesium_polylepis.1